MEGLGTRLPRRHSEANDKQRDTEDQEPIWQGDIGECDELEAG